MLGKFKVHDYVHSKKNQNKNSIFDSEFKHFLITYLSTFCKFSVF